MNIQCNSTCNILHNIKYTTYSDKNNRVIKGRIMSIINNIQHGLFCITNQQMFNLYIDNN